MGNVAAKLDRLLKKARCTRDSVFKGKMFVAEQSIFRLQTNNSPRHTNRAGPSSSRASAPSQWTTCFPPGACASTGDTALPTWMAAIAEAQEPVPEDWVSPA